MPKKKYSLEPGGAGRVEIEWRGIWKDVRVRLDGHELGVFANKTELEAGREFALPTGGVLGVQLVRRFAAVELRVLRDGVPLPGSATDPRERVKQAAYVLYFIAALNVALGALAELAGVDFLRSIGLGWASVAEGAIYAVLGWRTWKSSSIALGLGIALYALDTLVLLYDSLHATAGVAPGGLIARLYFFVPLVNGFQALRELDRKRA
jgi:hypothetical protein